MLKSLFNTERNGIYIAEIGLNHNGDINIAEKMILAAKKAGADAVKFQTFVPEKMNSIYTRSLLENRHPLEEDREIIDFLSTFTFSPDQYRRLKETCDRENIVFFSAPFDIESVELLEKTGVPCYKIASSEVTNIPLLRHISKKEKPVIISTGMAAEEEIQKAIEALGEHSTIALLHCVSLYPAAPEAVNGERVASLKKRFGRDIGYSDHTPGSTASIVAAAMGARIFERHFKLDRGHQCPDRDVSSACLLCAGSVSQYICCFSYCTQITIFSS